MYCKRSMYCPIWYTRIRRHVIDKLANAVVPLIPLEKYHDPYQPKPEGDRALIPNPEEAEFLPPHSDKIDTRPIMLDMLQKPNVFPFTREQARIFQRAQFVTWRNNNGLGLFGYATLIGIPVLLTIFTLHIISHRNFSDVHVGNGWFLAMNFFALVVSNTLGWIYTGTWPNSASQEENRDQNNLKELQARLDDLGTYVLMEYANPDTRDAVKEKIANINIRHITEKLAACSTQTNAVKTIINYFGHVCKFVNTGSAGNITLLEMTLSTLRIPYTRGGSNGSNGSGDGASIATSEGDDTYHKAKPIFPKSSTVIPLPQPQHTDAESV